MAEARKTVTIVFSDVAGSTSLGDRLDRVRTGVNTGEVVTGVPSGGQFHATGDAVNVAKRFVPSRARSSLVSNP
jgi:class 3 adenylate cyclase